MSIHHHTVSTVSILGCPATASVAQELQRFPITPRGKTVGSEEPVTTIERQLPDQQTGQMPLVTHSSA